MRLRCTFAAACAAAATLALAPAALADVFTVNAADDTDGACTLVHCSLREALEAANAMPGADVIAFAIGAGGSQTIAVPTMLPAITDPVTIDGTTQPGYAGSPLVEIDGSADTASSQYGLWITSAAGGTTIRGLSLGGFATGNSRPLQVEAPATVVGNWIGLAPDGSVDPDEDGIVVNGAWGVAIGGTAAADGNVISGSSNIGVLFQDGSGAVVEGNDFGADPTGALGPRNNIDVLVENSSDVRVGAPGAGNVMLGQVPLFLNTAPSAVVEANRFGLDTSGNVRDGGSIGIVATGSPGATIGGTGPGRGNVFAGFQEEAIIAYSDATIVGNFIGTDESGALRAGNGVGIDVAGGTVTIGGATMEDGGNVIAHSTVGAGVRSDGGHATVLANSIFDNAGPGIDAPGPAPALALGSVGAAGTDVSVSVSGAASSSYRVDLYASAACDPSGSGEGEWWLATTTVATDAAGNGTTTATVPVPPGDVVTATTTGASGDTSPFSACVSRPVDTTAPTVTILSAPGPLTNSRSASVSFSADESAAFTCALDGAAPGPCTSPQSFTALADGVHTLIVTATDAAGNAGSASTTWTVDATPPTVGAVSPSPNPVSTAQTTTVTAAAADSGSGVAGGEYFLGADPGAGNGTPMTLTGGAVSAQLGPLAAGVYTVSVRVRDLAGNWSGPAAALLAVYDPSGGYVTGGGWIVPGGATSDAGDLLPGLDGTSTANFGLVVRYQDGSATVPAGSFQFHYDAGKFHLRSTSYDWLVVTNPTQASFQGRATIDGATGTYPFRVDVIDGDSNGGEQTDRLSVRIWAPGADPGTAALLYKASGDVSGGQIIIHRQ